MKKKTTALTNLDLKYRPLTTNRWPDFEKLFGKSGAYGGCWCMWWRISRAEFDRQKGDGNRRAMKKIVQSGEVPGILAYDQREAVGWCSVAPREAFPSLNRSPVLKRIDDLPVWSIVCFFVAKAYRRRGLTEWLIKAAVDHVRQSGGGVVEAYPTDPRGRNLPPVSSFMGMPALYDRAGFEECARPSAAKVIMRYWID